MTSVATFTIENFPFDNLRISSKADSIKSDFGDVHQPTKLLVDDQLVNYRIEWPPMVSDSATYYIPKGNNSQDPRLYLHPRLHPQWENGHATSPSGLKIEAFEKKFLEAVNRECEKLNETDRGWIMGSDFKKNKASERSFIEPMANFPTYQDSHPKAGDSNEDKSKTLHMSIWTADVEKRALNDKNKKKLPTKPSADGSPAKATAGQNELIIPGTNIIIYTAIYDTTLKSRARGEKITKYEECKRFIYSSSGEENASPTNAELLVKLVTLAPSVCWKPADNKKGKFSWKISDMTVMKFAPRSYSKALSAEQLDQIALETKRAMEEYGLHEETDEGENTQQQTVVVTLGNDCNELAQFNLNQQQECLTALGGLEDTQKELLAQREECVDDKALQSVNQQIKMITNRLKRKRQELEDLRVEHAELNVAAETQPDAKQQEEEGGAMNEDVRDEHIEEVDDTPVRPHKKHKGHKAQKVH